MTHHDMDIEHSEGDGLKDFDTLRNPYQVPPETQAEQEMHKKEEIAEAAFEAGIGTEPPKGWTVEALQLMLEKGAASIDVRKLFGDMFGDKVGEQMERVAADKRADVEDWIGKQEEAIKKTLNAYLGDDLAREVFEGTGKAALETAKRAIADTADIDETKIEQYVGAAVQVIRDMLLASPHAAAKAAGVALSEKHIANGTKVFLSNIIDNAGTRYVERMAKYASETLGETVNAVNLRLKPYHETWDRLKLVLSSDSASDQFPPKTSEQGGMQMAA